MVLGGALGQLEGEVVPAGTDAGETIEAVTAQLYYRPFVVGEPPSQATADRAAAVAAASAGALSAAGIS